LNFFRFMTPNTISDEPYITRKLMIIAEKNPGGIEMSAGQPSENSIPLVGATFRCSDGTQLEITEEEMKTVTPYQSKYGLPQLTSWIQRIHKEFHSPPKMDWRKDGSEWDVCVGTGAMSVLDCIFPVVIQRDDVVLVEEYCYGPTKKRIKQSGAVLLGIPMDGDGIIPEKLREYLANWQSLTSAFENGRKLRAPRVLITVPVGHNPTGSLSPLCRKKEIYKIAQEYNILILEDDPYYFIQSGSRLVPSYQSMDVDGRVLRIDSMSKFVAPGLRIGWISGPKVFIEKFTDVSLTSVTHTSNLSQMAVVKFLDHWGLGGIRDRAERLGNDYNKRCLLADTTIRKHMGDMVTWTRPCSGMFLWLKILNTEDSMFTADPEFCKKHAVYVVPGREFASDLSKPSPYIRLCFANMNIDTMDEAIRRLKNLIQDGI
uniref:Aminotransferase class I/classII large domain-containing protein n=1 Tax=Ciona savignyi TaxID=51511 RepID=H2ZBC4_CIOSA